MGEAKMKEYGGRLATLIQRFLKKHAISVEYVRSKRPAKRAKLGAKESDHKPQASEKTGKEIIMIDDQDDEFDEFDTGIDFSAIQMPESSSTSGSAKKSQYFGR